MSPLRLSAFTVLAAALLVTLWMALGIFGISPTQGDPFYQAASSRNQIVFPMGLAAIALVVAQAASTGLAKRRRAAAGLWMILIGAAILLVFTGAEYWGHLRDGPPMRVRTVEYSELGYFLAYGLGVGAAVILLLAGVALWMSARLAGRRNRT
ncbi:hypothetical protein P1X14_07460 [Sphingomonas sp. AOB5]|uniref:hypothetical protein n=1 Tax=Sphingomonas sp. AOB5 TaxID=3034017 RepID=UPI0023F6ABEB|nr:hypothetical protein [Sphingomonas sp. AOB5]MDF7775078.1 hypothetical protein [Sphingomonas sp. AOB5]